MEYNMGKTIGIIVVVALLLFVMPLAFIWALNTLFPVLAIPMTVETWLAAFIVQAAIRSTVKVGK
jgi:hypothetical protein